jgi:hypothetical protein
LGCVLVGGKGHFGFCGEDGAADDFRDCRDDGVAEAMQSVGSGRDAFGDTRDRGFFGPSDRQAVQPSGKPINHSTQEGLSWPPSGVAFAISAGDGVLPFAWLDDRTLLEAVGVVTQIFPAALATAVANPSPLVGETPFRLYRPQMLGVGHIFTHRFKETDLFVSKFSVSDDVDSRTM